MPATSVSAAENYIPARKTARIFGDHAGNPTGRAGRKSSNSQRDRERERERVRERERERERNGEKAEGQRELVAGGGWGGG